MKKYSILLFSLVLGLTSCNHSDDDATPDSAQVYTKYEKLHYKSSMLVK